ncbi:hypothetical protein TYRP_015372 [Tyrophagus putrescentiae]|nr:hypothetical protein TYRP_015372 [Tyrophagus putrescentiae]
MTKSSSYEGGRSSPPPSSKYSSEGKVVSLGLIAPVNSLSCEDLLQHLSHDLLLLYLERQPSRRTLLYMSTLLRLNKLDKRQLRVLNVAKLILACSVYKVAFNKIH